MSPIIVLFSIFSLWFFKASDACGCSNMGPNDQPSSQAYQGAQQISSNANNQFKSQILQNRRRSGNNIPTDANLQQILQLGGAPTGDTGFALNNDISNYNWNNYATPQRVQCAPSQAQNFYNSMNSFGDSPGPNTFNNVITAMQQWNAATPVNNG